MISLLSTGVHGIQLGMQGLEKNAHQIAHANVKTNTSAQQTSDLTTPLVEMKINKLQVQASAEIIQTADQILGTLLDIKV